MRSFIYLPAVTPVFLACVQQTVCVLELLQTKDYMYSVNTRANKNYVYVHL